MSKSKRPPSWADFYSTVRKSRERDELLESSYHLGHAHGVVPMQQDLATGLSAGAFGYLGQTTRPDFPQ